MKRLAHLPTRDGRIPALSLGYIVVAVVLLIDGLLFNAFALGSDTARKSSEVPGQFFYFSSGTTMVASLFLSMRLLAEERAKAR